MISGKDLDTSGTTAGGGLSEVYQNTSHDVL